MTKTRQDVRIFLKQPESYKVRYKVTTFCVIFYLDILRQ